MGLQIQQADQVAEAIVKTREVSETIKRSQSIHTEVVGLLSSQ